MPAKKNILTEIFCLASTVFFIWVWTGNPVLAAYNLQLTALLVIVYFVIRFFFGKKDSPMQTYLLCDFAVFVALLLLVLSSTGGLGSSFFFLTYFLLFGVALLFEPIVTLTLTLSLTFYFIGSLTSFNSILQILSLLFMTPLAIFLGSKYLRLLESREKIKILNQESKKLIRTVTKEETDVLLWLSLNFKDNLLKIIHHSAELLSDLGHVTLNQKEHLEKIHDSAKDLLKSGEKLERQIDKETD